ncbi:MAG: transposase [Chlorobiaceae bacterium]|nr:transposase [Chlorobiaceae bacterium]
METEKITNNVNPVIVVGIYQQDQLCSSAGSKSNGYLGSLYLQRFRGVLQIRNNRTISQECLNDNWFLSLHHAREIIETWRIDYNANWPHITLEGLTPAEFAAQIEENFQIQVFQ